LFELKFFVPWKFCRPPALRYGDQGFNAAITVGVVPALHKILASAKHTPYLFGAMTIKSQRYCTVPFSLFGIALF
jgi:hypothetical protein